jgi:hypothetical protein
MTVHKSPYAKLLPDGSYEFGVYMRPEGERRDIPFPQGTAPDYDTAMHRANRLRLLDYSASATYATPAGGIGHWSGVVLALNHATAHYAADKLIRKQRKVAGKLDIKITGPGEQQPLVSLPDLARILHNAGIKAGDNQSTFADIAADVLAYQVPTPPDYAIIGPAAFSRDAGMMMDVQNIVRAALRAIDAERHRCAAAIDLWHGSTSPAAKAVRNGTPERNHPND